MTITKINEIDNLSKLEEIFDKELYVYEDIQGSRIYVNFNDNNIIIKPKNINAESINMDDLAIQKYYSIAFNYFKSLNIRIVSLLNKNWWFCFEYFVDNCPGNIEYKRIPKHNLVLTAICKYNKFNYTYEELIEYARLMDVDVIPVVFKGKLNDKVIEFIKCFLNTSENDLEYVFGEKNFAYFFYKILNPNINNSFLMDDEFHKNIEKLIIKVDGDEHSFELLNPLYRKISNLNTTDFVEIYTLILFNFLSFCQYVDIDSSKIKGKNRKDCYIYLMCKLYNEYLLEVKDDLLKFDFIVPEFFDTDKFRINIELIPDKTTKSYIMENKKLEYIFKIIIGSFNSIKQNPIGVFNENTLNVFNLFVKTINSKIDLYYSKKSEIELTRSDLLDFGSFFDIKYDKDASGKVYLPDVYKKIENDLSDDKKQLDDKYGKIDSIKKK